MNRLKLVPQTVPQTVPQRPAKAPRRKHLGVTLIKPTPPKSPRWRMRYLDPETRKLRFESLPDEIGCKVELRTDAAIAKAKHIAKRRDEITGGGVAAHTAADMPITEAIQKYFDEVGFRKSPRTQKDYRGSCDLFETWCGSVELRTVRQLSKAKLAQYATSRAKAPKLAGARTRRGKRLAESANRQRSEYTINREIREVGIVLHALRRRDVVRLSHEEISDGLEHLDVFLEKKPFHHPAELRAIILAALAHDADVFKLTRKGKAAGKRASPEVRYTPVLPVVLFILLTGVRVKEALTIAWSDVAHGSITVRGRLTKTRRFRTIDLAHSPMLAAMLVRGGRGLVLGEWTKDALDTARARLVNYYKAPHFTFQGLRRSCGTYLTCAPSIFGDAAPYMSAKQLGHSVTIAEKHYTGVIKISAEARTTEAAMQLDQVLTPAQIPHL